MQRNVSAVINEGTRYTGSLEAFDQFVSHSARNRRHGGNEALGRKRRAGLDHSTSDGSLYSRALMHRLSQLCQLSDECRQNALEPIPAIRNRSVRSVQVTFGMQD
jgi:hypothetical protein